MMLGRSGRGAAASEGPTWPCRLSTAARIRATTPPPRGQGRGPMWQALKRTAFRLLDTAKRSLRRPRRFPAPQPNHAPPAASYGPLRRVRLTDGVAHTLFEEYADHRCEARGDEETGWVLLGLREAEEAVV